MNENMRSRSGKFYLKLLVDEDKKRVYPIGAYHCDGYSWYPFCVASQNL